MWDVRSSYIEMLIDRSTYIFNLPSSVKTYCRKPGVRSHIPKDFAHVIHLILIVIIQKLFAKFSPQLAAVGPTWTPTVCPQPLQQMTLI
jgi:hypothetical protein